MSGSMVQRVMSLGNQTREHCLLLSPHPTHGSLQSVEPTEVVQSPDPPIHGGRASRALLYLLL